MFLVSFAVGFSGAATPGPMLLVTVSEVARSGLIAAALIVAGHASMELLATAGLYLGLLEVAGGAAVSAAVALTGGVFLLFIGAMTMRDAVSPRDPLAGAAAAAPAKRRTRLAIFGIGILVTIGNPYWTVWWLTFGANLVSESIRGPAGSVPAFYAGHVLSDLVWYLAAGLAVVAGGRFFRGRAYRWVLGGCAVFLILFGGLFLFRGARMLLA